MVSRFNVTDVLLCISSTVPNTSKSLHSRGKRLFRTLIIKGKRYTVTKWKTFLAELCSILYKEDPSIIRAMANGVRQPGKKRVKMSVNKADINSPVKIAGSDIWVETRRSAADIRRAILILLDYYNIPTESVKVYFRRDYTAMHADDAKLE